MIHLLDEGRGVDNEIFGRGVDNEIFALHVTTLASHSLASRDNLMSTTFSEYFL